MSVHDKVALGKVQDKEMKTPLHAFAATITHLSLKGLNSRINPDKPPRNFSDAIKSLDKQAWIAWAAYSSEYLGSKQWEVVAKIVEPEPGFRIHDTITKLVFREDNGEFLEC